MLFDNLCTAFSGFARSRDARVLHFVQNLQTEQIYALVYANLGAGAMIMMGLLPSGGRFVKNRADRLCNGVRTSIEERRYRKQLRRNLASFLMKHRTPRKLLNESRSQPWSLSTGPNNWPTTTATEAASWCTTKLMCTLPRNCTLARNQKPRFLGFTCSSAGMTWGTRRQSHR